MQPAGSVIRSLKFFRNVRRLANQSSTPNLAASETTRGASAPLIRTFGPATCSLSGLPYCQLANQRQTAVHPIFTDHCDTNSYGGTTRFLGAGPLRIRPDVS